MSEEKKDDCCGTKGSGCCGSKKLLCGVLFALVIFIAGMLFVKACPIGKTCPFSSAQQK